jgi:hydroxymethylpyrimidine pyrophosphatase-like HAD family hydrolase
VVFLSIVINHIGDINPYSFVWNRFLDTMIGIVIGLFLNNMRICFNPDRETLFVSGVDDILVDKNNKVSAFSKVELNRMIEDGMRFTFSTVRTPASVLEPLSDINLKYPIVVMDGAALYDVKNNEYKSVFVISPDTAKELVDLISADNMYPYINVIIDDTLLIYYNDTPDEVNQNLVKTMRTSPYRNYIKRDYPCDEKVVYIMLLDTDERINAFYDKLIKQEYDKILKIVRYSSEEHRGYSYIKIYNKNASKDKMLTYLKNNCGITQTLTFGTVAGKYDVVIKKNSFNEMVKRVRKKYEPFIGRNLTKAINNK